MAPPRTGGTRWRLLAHDKRGHAYGLAHHVASGPHVGCLPGCSKEHTNTKHETRTILPGTEFDEIVVGHWLHVEQMDANSWWMNVGGVTLWVKTDRDGYPKAIQVYGPDDYDDAADGCKYNQTWSKENDD